MNDQGNAVCIYNGVYSVIKKEKLLFATTRYNMIYKKYIFDLGTSLVVQWLGLHAPNAGGLTSIPDQETRSYMLQLKPSTVR